ncbi:hypothetical protein L2E82_14900 [Cichorium intybus]|uniref:Uncharacterized protein n=1 Tax=Cichorium intybus TaxID=13427 RepID=A0ACB9F275_CICIN|nr:hypothetical protein L2E82_14900 [Cichorium intybus]
MNSENAYQTHSDKLCARLKTFISILFKFMTSEHQLQHQQMPVGLFLFHKTIPSSTISTPLISNSTISTPLKASKKH